MANHKNITRTEDTRQKKTRTQDKNEATKNRLQLKESFIFFYSDDVPNKKKRPAH